MPVTKSFCRIFRIFRIFRRIFRGIIRIGV
jgi:hypothetical protein